jgi:hypothetical protein
MFYYLGNSGVGFIPSLFNYSSASLIETEKPAINTTTKDLIGDAILVDGNKVLLKNISYETEGAFVCAAYVETDDQKNFRIVNKNQLDSEEFEMEVILYLESLLYKE